MNLCINFLEGKEISPCSCLRAEFPLLGHSMMKFVFEETVFK